ncbi:hypothetical protein DPMN_191452 [Dreissena polymorpha]|uniref:Uncharacterized protein n=1 Tax=Dreissena polymorpha TaxID=45954 RepID=A0A9D4BCY9_DREPO|nr:hypothetical protein DPMN_191452 [Dreissena polymorpha]
MTTFVIDAESVMNEVNIWIIIGAVLGAVVLLIIVGIILWRCGFFKRSQKHDQVKKWKQDGLYNRENIRMSQANKQTYSPIEETTANASDL